MNVRPFKYWKRIPCYYDAKLNQIQYPKEARVLLDCTPPMEARAPSGRACLFECKHKLDIDSQAD